MVFLNFFHSYFDTRSRDGADESPTEEQALAEWVERQRIAYELGELSESEISKLEAIPNWTWKID